MARSARRPRRQAQSARLLVAAGGLLAIACANQGDPPGGPPDTAPPAILAVRPDSGAIVPGFEDDAVIQFDEVIDEMGGPGAGGTSAALAGLERQVLLSPVVGPVKVSWHRSSIHVKPKEGWKPNRVYRLELLPGIVDLRRNTVKTGRTLIFSTGPALPSARLEGTALLWVEQRALMLGLIQAMLLPDTAPYLAVADSSGRFHLDGIPAGRYLIYAVNDQNGNHLRDRREAYDSAIVSIDSSAATVLWTFVHDTVGPRLRSAEPKDSLSALLTFGAPLDPRAPLDTARVRVLALPDSTPVPVAGLMTVPRYDSLVARERASADSARRAADTTAKRDTTTRRDTSRTVPDSTPTTVTAGQQPPVDTSAARRLLRERPVPFDKVVVRTGRPFVAGQKYLIRVTGATNLNGARADGQAVLTVPKPAARDSTRVPRDSTAVPPARRDSLP